MLALLLALTANAADPEFEGADAAGQKFEEPETDLSIELGGSMTTGNTVLYTLTSGVKAGRRWGQNKLRIDGSALVGSSIADGDGDGKLSDDERHTDMVRSAERFIAEGRYDRFFGTKNSLYVLVGGLRDTFAGYDLRSHEQIGYSRVLVDTDDTSLVTEIGVDWAQENYVAGVDPGYRDIVAGRLMLGVEQSFSTNLSLSDTVEVYENVLDPEDLRILNEAAITAKLSEVLSLKLSHKLMFDNQPVEGFRPVDQTGLATLVASIF